MAEGVPFVNESSVFKMGLAPESETSKMLKPIWVTTETDVFHFDRVPSAKNNTDIGSLKGLLMARGSDTANYTDIPIRREGESDTAYESRVDAYNNQVEASVMRTIQAQFDQLIHGLVTAINDVFAPNTKAILAGDIVDADGNPIVLPDGTTLTGDTNIMVLDDNAPVGQDPDHTRGEAIFNRKSMDHYTIVTGSVYVLDENGEKIVDDEDPSGFKTETKELYIYNEENPDGQLFSIYLR